MQPGFLEKDSVRDGVAPPIYCLRLHNNKTPNPNREIHPHYHDTIEFLYGTENCNVEAWIAGERVIFREGDLLIINSSVMHDFVNLSQNTNYLCFKVKPEVIYFSENPMYDIRYVVPFLQSNLVPYQLFLKEQIPDSLLPGLFDGMMKEWERQEYGYEIALKDSILRLFLWIIRTNYANNRLPMAGKTEIPEDRLRIIQRSMEEIGKRYAEITEVQAAAEAGMSYSYYSRIFRRVAGKSFHSFLVAVRINAAERLLLLSNRSVTEIALDVGFSTSSHFIESFRRARGVTPLQYRSGWKNKS